MARKFLLILALVFVGAVAHAQTSLAGKVTNEETGEALEFANIVLYKNGVYSAGTSADLDGTYSINVDAGTYDVEVSYIGLPDTKITGVLVKSGQSNKLDVKMGAGDGAVLLDEVIVKSYKVPLIEQDNTTTGKTLTSEEIQNLPTKNINALASTAAGLSSADEGDRVTVRGSRSESTNYYIDGIRVSSNNLIPQSEIDQLQIITGGIEARYGDVTGGIISITTKGPSQRYTGGFELETSEYLDSYGYNLASLNLSGPIIKNKVGKTILGFRVSGQYLDQKDDDPAATDIFQVKEDVLRDLEANPILENEGSRLLRAEFLTDDDINVLDYKPNEERTRYDLTAKIDARLSENIDISLSGSYNHTENKFTPFRDYANNSSFVQGGWRLFNTQNNPTQNIDRYRASFRFRHRLGAAPSLEPNAEGATKAKGSVIRNAEYTLQAGYELSRNNTSDPRHGDRLFDYGHVGTFDYEWQPTTGQSEYSFFQDNFNGVGHVDFSQNFLGYTPGTANPAISNLNNSADVDDVNDFIAMNGRINSVYTSVYGFHVAPGAVYDRNSKGENETYTFNANSSFDLLPGGSEKGRHSIQFGIMYEQRVSRGYSVSPSRLWEIGRLQANNHILGVDTSSFDINNIQWYQTSDIISEQTGFDSLPLLGTLIEGANDLEGLRFYRAVREINNVDVGQYINVDGLSPDQLSLDMFAPVELTDQGLASFYGYDYLGNKVDADVTFDDFFNSETNYADGARSFLVAPERPIYGAAYIQDKFTFKDIIFRVGVRVDRFDANTKVLKDIYSLYEVQNAADFYNGDGSGQTRPGTVEDDFKIYTVNPNSNVVKAFRDGDQWYFANGTPANGGQVIFDGPVTAKYANPEAGGNYIKESGFEVSSSFEDYEPQVNWMPRLAFSFPISDEANFFAHYDVLVQRPISIDFNVNRATALDYYYFPDAGRKTTANPNLRPEKTVDYEVGFNQKLSSSSALKISAYYKELRDMIQRSTVLFIPSDLNASNYDTYSNVDFGTVKGFSLQYDLRRTGNVTFTANYTLQFADGTGSDANSQRGLTENGNLRTLFPLSFDERHRLVATVDYRYASGKRYNGPKWFGADVFANAGVNLQAIAVSGRPYTASRTVESFSGTGTLGSINGARLPWNFTLNLRLDKNFTLSKSEKFPLDLNVYLRVQNLLDQRNVRGVYSATNSPDDDGFLSSSIGRQTLESSVDPIAYQTSYQWALVNPNFYSLPRRIFVGAIFGF